MSNPISFNRSKDSIVSSFPRCLKVSKIKFPKSPFNAGSLKKPSSSGHIVLNSTRPTVVQIQLFLLIPKRVSFPLSGFFILIQSCKLSAPSCKALKASSRHPINGNLSPSFGSFLGFIVRKYEPRTMSCEGVRIGLPLDGENML